MTTSKEKGLVTIEYGDLGIEDAELVLWTKKGAARAVMNPKGGTVTFRDVRSLF